MPESPPSAAPANPSVLVVEDDAAAAEVIALALGAHGFRVRVCTTGREAIAAMAVDEPDIVVLDLGLPDIDGLDVCVAIRRWSGNPIVVLSADGADDRKVRALDLGADDYVTKPYSMGELLARMRVALRHRRTLALIVDPPVMTLGDLVVDVGARSAIIDGEPLSLTRQQFSLLALLARNPGRVLTQATIVDAVWEKGGGGSGPLYVHINKIRRKLGEGPHRPKIESEPGVGYRLVLSERG